jgi:heterotetrameric sarcosine oxidase gamma subunit
LIQKEGVNVVDITLTASPALAANVSIGENHIALRDDLALVSIATPLGGEAQLAKALKDGWSLDMPDAQHLSVQDEIQAIQTAPDQMLLVFAHPTPDANAVVQARLNGAGYTTDQTDTYVVLEVSGPDTRSALERICPIDLHHGSSGHDDCSHWPRSVPDDVSAIFGAILPTRDRNLVQGGNLTRVLGQL